MKNCVIGFILIFLPFASHAGTCEQTWFHIAGFSKHIEVYQANEYTRYKRQTHPGFGMECQTKKYTFAAGEFRNSLDRPFQYATATKTIASLPGYNTKLLAGLMAGEYGRTEREPLRLVAPIAYIEYQYKHVGLNFFTLPPAKGFNDYVIFFTQFKVRF